MNIMKERSILVVKDWIIVVILVKIKKNVIKLFIVGWLELVRILILYRLLGSIIYMI